MILREQCNWFTEKDNNKNIFTTTIFVYTINLFDTEKKYLKIYVYIQDIKRGNSRMILPILKYVLF